MTAVVTSGDWVLGGGGAAPSAACRRLAALMELDEQAEEQRRAAKLQAQRDKAAAAHKAAEAQGIDPKTKEINGISRSTLKRYMLSRRSLQPGSRCTAS